MRRFFSDAFDKGELALHQGKIYLAEERVASCRRAYDQAVDQRNTINSKLSNAQNRVAELECSSDRKYEREQKQLTLDNLRREGSRLNDEYQRMLQEAARARYIKAEKESRLDTVRQRLAEANDQINILRQEINDRDEILNEPAPTPQYRLDGEYCINGIYLCKNHPPRQILENEREIARHRRKVSQALSEKNNLIDKLNQLYQNCNELQEEYSRLKSELQLAIEADEQCQARLQDLQQQINDNQLLCEQTQQEYDSLLQEENKTNEALNEARNIVNNLAYELDNAEYAVSNAEIELQNAEFELTRLREEHEGMESNKERDRQAQLEALAQQEVLRESEPNTMPVIERESSNDGASPEPLMDKLRRLALKELEEEAEKAADKLLDKTIDGARKAGLITERAKKDLKAIKKFGNNVIQEFTGNIDQFIEEAPSETQYRNHL